MTYAEYRAIDEASEQRCEFFEGEVFAMAGGTVAHANVQGGVLAAVAHVLDGSPCRPRGSLARVYFPGRDEAAYPDVHVVCGRTERDPADADATINPVVIVEVLSPSTEAWDRGGKFRRYESLPSVRQILLVATADERVESFVRNDDDSWTRRVYESGAEVPLVVGASIAVDKMYALQRAELAAG